MQNLRLYSTISKSLIPETHTKKLAVLIEWCKIIHGCIEAGQIEDAKIFLEQAIQEAEMPSRE
ncbi:hypothetical protein H6G80_05665 [Nostoc sp. FACHB-87]|uniref:Uncharacterized protein n=1 Tax=Nostoc piscinale CENA21 TaxID=224013 RepID=A0A0M4SNJ5_9NOSO|nr:MULTISPECIES: hypothetical protein [Nostocales]ALF54835.1 hypothetical protein ACX27_21580 [Nostoc piscinale CENA21]MBD2300662.1 hypothetical protein [Nostoc sp. FACHB-190]MBD2453561.1 hypothetical protein [Nostoc sp. FACHB-87]MBD2475686.1 hypothetical protein [Anabaena sp. FACHB-83]MBD2490187.1 hypothetical protein [Aulosira sp. FACHB-615]